MQKESRNIIDLFDNKRKLMDTSCYSRKLLIDYNRKRIPNKLRLKEWDFYQIQNQDYCLQMSMSRIGLAIDVNATLFSLDGKIRHSVGVTKLLSFKAKLESNADFDHYVYYDKSNFHIGFGRKYDKRTLTLRAKEKDHTYKINIVLEPYKTADNISLAHSFKNKKQFFLNCKQNTFYASGFFEIDDKRIVFNKGTSSALLDWGRGVWPHKTSWKWANANSFLPNGDSLGFNLGFGFGNETIDATENAFFHNGTLNKLDKINVQISSIMKPYKIASDDNRFVATFTPTYDNHTKKNYLILKMNCHQVFGYFDGKVILDNNKTLEFHNMHGFFEQCKNEW